MKWLVVTVLLLLNSGCFVSTPAAPPPVPPEVATEVEQLRARADAIMRVSADVRDRGATNPFVRGRAGQAHSAAGDTVIVLDFRRDEQWLQKAREKLHVAEAFLTDAISAGGSLDPNTCSVEAVRTALPEPCAKAALGPSSADPARPTHDEVAKSIKERTDAIHAGASAAVAKVGDENSDTMRVARSFAHCQPSSVCLQRMEQSPDRVGAYAGMAIELSESVQYKFKAFHGMNVEQSAQEEREAAESLKLAEDLVRKAHEEADKVVAAQQEQLRRIAAESQPIQDATTACATNETACKSRCDKGEPYMCLALGVRMNNANPPKHEEAKKYYQKACDGQVQSACSTMHLIDEEIRDAAAETNSRWSDVADVGDDLAQKRHQVETVLKLANTPHLQITLERMRTINAAVVAEKYCPARKEFVTKAGIAEFQKRAAAHCKDEAPTATGLSGAPVTLVAQCQAAFATACP